MDKNTNVDLQVPFDEAKRMLADQMDSIATIKDTLKTIFNATTLVVALAGSLQTMRGGVSVENLPLYTSIVVVTLLLFAVVIGFCLWGMKPKAVNAPILMDWDLLSSTFFGQEDRDVLKIMISQFVEAIANNRPVIEKMAWKANMAGAGFILVVLGMIGLILIP